MDPIEQTQLNMCEHCKKEIAIDSRVHECIEMYINRCATMAHEIGVVRALKQKLVQAPEHMQATLIKELLDAIETLNISTAGPAALVQLQRYEAAEKMCNAVTIAELHGNPDYVTIAEQCKREWWQFVLWHDMPMHHKRLSSFLQLLADKMKEILSGHPEVKVVRLLTLLNQLSRASERLLLSLEMNRQAAHSAHIMLRRIAVDDHRMSHEEYSILNEELCAAFNSANQV